MRGKSVFCKLIQIHAVNLSFRRASNEENLEHCKGDIRTGFIYSLVVKIVLQKNVSIL